MPIAASWGLNPETATLAVSLVTGAGIISGALFAAHQVRELRRARDADVLLKFLELLSTEFLPTETYDRLLARATAMQRADQTMSWRGPLDADEMALLRLLKLYATAGWMLKEKMIQERILLSFIAEPLLHHHQNFAPFIQSAMEREGIDFLRNKAIRAGYRTSALRYAPDATTREAQPEPQPNSLLT